MAYFHASWKTITPKDRCGAGPKADYIMRQGAYAARGGLVASGAGNMPTWSATNPAIYFYAADAHERANGRLAKTLDAEIPVELVRVMSPDERVNFVESVIREVANTPDGPLPYIYAIHSDGKGEKLHFHAAVSERVNDGLDRAPDLWFRRANGKDPAAGGARKTDALKPKEWLIAFRKMYAERLNEQLEAYGYKTRVDHRSFEAQGLSGELATKHLGPKEAALERRGIATPTGDYNRAVKAKRAELGIYLTPKVEEKVEERERELEIEHIHTPEETEDQAKIEQAEMIEEEIDDQDENEPETEQPKPRPRPSSPPPPATPATAAPVMPAPPQQPVDLSAPMKPHKKYDPTAPSAGYAERKAARLAAEAERRRQQEAEIDATRQAEAAAEAERKVEIDAARQQPPNGVDRKRWMSWQADIEAKKAGVKPTRQEEHER